MYFPMSQQSIEACDFNGVAKISKQNYSTNECLFSVELMSGAGKNVAGISVLIGWLSFLVLF